MKIEKYINAYMDNVSKSTLLNNYLQMILMEAYYKNYSFKEIEKLKFFISNLNTIDDRNESFNENFYNQVKKSILEKASIKQNDVSEVKVFHSEYMEKLNSMDFVVEGLYNALNDLKDVYKNSEILIIGEKNYADIISNINRCIYLSDTIEYKIFRNIILNNENLKGEKSILLSDLIKIYKSGFDLGIGPKEKEEYEDIFWKEGDKKLKYPKMLEIDTFLKNINPKIAGMLNYFIKSGISKSINWLDYFAENLVVSMENREDSIDFIDYKINFDTSSKKVVLAIGFEKNVFKANIENLNSIRLEIDSENLEKMEKANKEEFLEKINNKETVFFISESEINELAKELGSFDSSSLSCYKDKISLEDIMYGNEEKYAMLASLDDSFMANRVKRILGSKE